MNSSKYNQEVEIKKLANCVQIRRKFWQNLQFCAKCPILRARADSAQNSARAESQNSRSPTLDLTDNIMGSHDRISGSMRHLLTAMHKRQDKCHDF